MRRNPFEELETMLERMSDQIEGGVAGPEGSVPVDVRDEGEAFVVAVDLPGYDADEVDLTLSERRLTVAAERDRDEEQREGDYVRRERRHTAASRTVRLPADVDEDAVEASLDAGVLTVRLPKREREAGRRIDIED